MKTPDQMAKELAEIGNSIENQAEQSSVSGKTITQCKVKGFAAYLTAEVKEKTCRWTWVQAGIASYWKGSCGHAMTTRPKKFCEDCGGRITEGADNAHR